MDLTFDLRAEWERMAAQLSWRGMARHRLGMEVLRVWQAIRRAPSEMIFAIHPLRGTGVVVRRMMWVMPRVSVRVTSGVGGTLLLCVFIGVGIRMWGTENGSAKAGVMRQPVEASVAQDVKDIEPEPQGATRSEPASPRIDEATRRRVALARAREQCMDRLAQTDEYARVKVAFDQLDDKVRALRSDDPFRELPRISVEWIQAKSELKRVVDEAMKTDSDVLEAEEAVKALGARKRSSGIDR